MSAVRIIDGTKKQGIASMDGKNIIKHIICFTSCLLRTSMKWNNETETCCPVADCMFKTSVRNMMRMHVSTSHNKETIVIEEAGKLPRCTKCGLLQKKVDLPGIRQQNVQNLLESWQTGKSKMPTKGS
jgi:hypothetical protein